MQSYVFCLLVVVAAAAAAPQREGAAYTKEAIKQAQNTHLIPHDAVIQKVRPPHHHTQLILNNVFTKRIASLYILKCINSRHPFKVLNMINLINDI